VPNGLTVTITGTNFVSGDQLAVGSAIVPATVTNPTTLTAVIPAADIATAGSIPLAIVDTSQLHSNPINLSVTTTATGTGVGGLSSLNPSSTPVATSPTGQLVLTVTGTGFDQSSVIVFNGQNLQTSVINPTTVVGDVPDTMLLQPAAVGVAVSTEGVLSGTLPFTIGTGGGVGAGTCQTTCQQLGLRLGQCATIGGINLFGVPVLGQQVQCGFDGCVTQGCH
jgi:hypothetical protein